MLFKDELPPARYAAELEDDEIQFTNEFEFDTEEIGSKTLVLVAPKLHKIIDLFQCSPLKEVDFKISRKLKEKFLISNSFYEVDPSDSDFNTTTTIKVHFYELPNLIFVLLPRLSDDIQDQYLGSALCAKMKPKRLVLATPGNTFMDCEVCCLKNNFPEEVNVKYAEPPSVILGAPAAALSYAVKNEIPALALLLKSEGAVNYEAFSFDGFELLCVELAKVLGIATEKSIREKVGSLHIQY